MRTFFGTSYFAVSYFGGLADYGAGAIAPTSVDVSPPGACLSDSEQLQFTAIVSGSSLAVSQAVTWAASLGSISPSGLFTAPPALPDQYQVLTVTAASAQDSAVSQEVFVTVAPADLTAPRHRPRWFPELRRGR